MNINLITDVALASSKQLPSTDEDLSLANSELFQQLLHANQNHGLGLQHSLNLMPKISDDSDADLQQDDNSLAMVWITPSPLEIVNSRSDLTLNDMIAHHLIEKSDWVLNANQSAKVDSLPLNTLQDADFQTIANNQVTELLISINDSEQLINNICQPDEFFNQRNGASNRLMAEDLADKTITAHYLQTDTSSQMLDSGSINKPIALFDQFATNSVDNDTVIHAQADNHFVTSINTFTQPFSQQAAPVSTSTFVMNLPMPVDVTQWQAALTEQISLITRQGLQSAEIKLHPEQLGSLHIKLDLLDDKINMHMIVAHSAVKGVLESTLPYLRASLEEQGMSLAQTNISDFSTMHHSEQSSGYKSSKNHQFTAANSDTIDESVEQVEADKPVSHLGLSIFA